MKGEVHSTGFTWGPVEVKRYFCDEKKGWVSVGVETQKHKRGIQIYVTKTGKVRIFSENGEWTAPK